MNVNFGLFPPAQTGGRLPYAERQMARKRAYTSRALSDFASWLGQKRSIAAE
jgi:methylenetetrahydrofolate--tRNA-(uracil-5-)-methyltransferase